MLAEGVPGASRSVQPPGHVTVYVTLAKFVGPHTVAACPLVVSNAKPIPPTSDAMARPPTSDAMARALIILSFFPWRLGNVTLVSTPSRDKLFRHDRGIFDLK